jgi:hypothetical protein
MEAPRRTIHPVDVQLLATLRDRRLDYATVLANAVDVDAEFADERLAHLRTIGLVERVTPEPVFRVTDRGAAYLAADDSLPMREADGDRRVRAVEGRGGPAPSS